MCKMNFRKSVNNFVVFLLCITFTFSPLIEAGIMKDLLNRAYSFLGYETCEHPKIHNLGAKRLRKILNKELFGQHLAVEITSNAVSAHLSDPNPTKALVLSLHGWAGAGKTFTSQHLMSALYENGVNSSFVRFFMASFHFSDPNRVEEYKRLLRRNIEQVAKHCSRGLFIFDEVDKTPSGVLDMLVPYIQHPGQILDGYEYKKFIFVFLSNVGANDITRITHLTWKEGRKREDLTFKDFEQVLSNEAFNTEGNGLYRSKMIDRVLVDYFVPYLPLERRHIISCIKVQAKRQGMDPAILDEEAEKIADMLTYWPADLKLYSTTGCKKVDTFVKYRISQLNFGNHSLDDDDDESDDIDDEIKTEL